MYHVIGMAHVIKQLINSPSTGLPLLEKLEKKLYNEVLQSKLYYLETISTSLLLFLKICI